MADLLKKADRKAVGEGAVGADYVPFFEYC
jgi:hypothetical protein